LKCERTDLINCVARQTADAIVSDELTPLEYLLNQALVIYQDIGHCILTKNNSIVVIMPQSDNEYVYEALAHIKLRHFDNYAHQTTLTHKLYQREVALFVQRLKHYLGQ